MLKNNTVHNKRRDDPMNRIFFTILLLLLLVTGGVLMWQWNIYKENSTDVQAFESNETISMSVTDNNIEINHEISGLPAGNYILQNINNKQISCQEDKKGCNLSNKALLKTSGGIIKLTYSLKKSKASAYILNNWAVQIKDVNINQTQVEITHYGKNTGIWAAGANIVGQTRKENISFFVFVGNNGVFPLYYENKGIKKTEKSGFAVYGDPTNTVIKAAKQYEIKPPFTFVISNKVDSFTSESLLIRSNKEKMKQVLSNRFYNINYPFTDKEEKWLKSVIGAYVLDEKVEGKPKKLMIELSKQLSSEQREQFISLLKKNHGHNFSSTYLDQLLSEATGMRSNYFDRNKSENRPVSPLYFMNNAKWIDANGVGSAVDSITMNSKRYYSLKQVANHLGFKMVKISNSQIYLADGSKSYRLYPGESTLLYNDKVYNIKGELLKVLNNELYINEEYLLKIFNTFVREQDNELQLISLN